MIRKKLLSEQLKCIICDNEQENQRTLFSFPKSPERKKKWLDILKIQEPQLKSRSRVCEKHFDKSQLSRTRLVKGAIPTLKPLKLATVDNNFRPPLLVNILPRTRYSISKNEYKIYLFPEIFAMLKIYFCFQSFRCAQPQQTGHQDA